MSSNIDKKAIATIRLLSVDQVSAANSGHPGAPLGLAPTAYYVWQGMKFDPKKPHWINRDRFILSNGHACALLYSLLHLYGFGMTIEDLKQFRHINSNTPGHPERGHVPGIEVTTGPLGQGISNAVGLAIAATQLGATYNKPDFDLINSYVFAFAGDGCLQEGVSSEASSIAGHLKLGNLIAFWDDNQITIDGETDFSFTENVVDRYKAYGWHVIEVDDAEQRGETLIKAIEEAKSVKDQPSLIRLKTIIGFGSLNQGTESVHGSPLKPDDVKQLKEKNGFDPEKSFVVPDDVKKHFDEHVKGNQKYEEDWNALFAEYKKKYPELGEALQRRLDGKLPANWEEKLPKFTSKDKAIATRKASETVLTGIWDAIPELIGGSADLTPSNLTKVAGSVDFQPPSLGLGDYSGRYLRYGVREHGMGAIMNGIAGYGANFKVYGGTFLNFVSYAAGAVRLSALSHLPVTWVATHDSIGLGEDGPTHQPIETLAHLRAIPNLSVWRPADGNETSAAYKAAVGSTSTPHVLALSRQNLPQLENSIEEASKGGYTLIDTKDRNIILVASGSEVHICAGAVEELAKEGIKASVVSLPSFFDFEKQSDEYKLSVLPDGVPILSVEVMTTFGWSQYSHQQFGIERFGISGKADAVYEYFGFTPKGIAEKAKATVDFYKGQEDKLLSPLKRAFKLNY